MVHRRIHHPINGLSLKEQRPLWIFNPKEHFCNKNKPKNVQILPLQPPFKESNHLLLASFPKTDVTLLYIPEVTHRSEGEGDAPQT